MNRENIKIVRDHIAGLDPEYFDMGSPCGSACCIGGWANALINGGNFRMSLNGPAPSAEAALGLNADDARDLFFPFEQSVTKGMQLDPYEASPAQAVRVLDHVRRVEVDVVRDDEVRILRLVGRALGNEHVPADFPEVELAAEDVVGVVGTELVGLVAV